MTTLQNDLFGSTQNVTLSKEDGHQLQSEREKNNLDSKINAVAVETVKANEQTDQLRMEFEEKTVQLEARLKKVKQSHFQDTMIFVCTAVALGTFIWFTRPRVQEF